MPYTDSMISPPATVSSGAQSPALPPAPAVDTALPSLDSAMADITGLKGHLLQLYALVGGASEDGGDCTSGTCSTSWQFLGHLNCALLSSPSCTGTHVHASSQGIDSAIYEV